MSDATPATPRIVRLRVGGMGCGGCVRAVQRALQGVPGVARALVELEGGFAEVEAAPITETADLVAAVERAGYDATPAP
jgi:Cu+-exporting ATPase